MAGAQNRRPQGVTLLAIYRFFVGAVSLAATGLLLLLALPVLLTAGDPTGVAVVTVLLGMVAMVTLVYAALSIAVGWGLLKMQPWSRWGALVLAILSLLDFPTGTAVGALTIWYLTQESLAAQFTRGDDLPPETAAE